MISVGFEFPAVEVVVTRELIRAYAEASFDFNPLHLDEEWMATAEFGGTRYNSVIAHGLMTYERPSSWRAASVHGPCARLQSRRHRGRIR